MKKNLGRESVREMEREIKIDRWRERGGGRERRRRIEMNL